MISGSNVIPVSKSDPRGSRRTCERLKIPPEKRFQSRVGSGVHERNAEPLRILQHRAVNSLVSRLDNVKGDVVALPKEPEAPCKSGRRNLEIGIEA